MLTSFLRNEGEIARKIGILDIGAMHIGIGKKEYDVFMEAGIANVIGFEPNLVECNKLNDMYAGGDIKFLPYFVGNGARQTFNCCQSPMTSSLYEPNQALTSLFNSLPELTVVTDRVAVETTKLDSMQEIVDPIDYIKIDVQGAELQAFEGGKKTLSNVTVIHCEVEWVPMYKGQPLFSEIEMLLRDYGFVVHTILGTGRRSFSPVIFNNNPSIGNQWLWSDVVFVRDFTRLDLIPDENLLIYAAIVNDIYRSTDLMVYLLGEWDRRKGSDLTARYFSWLASSGNRS